MKFEWVWRLAAMFRRRKTRLSAAKKPKTRPVSAYRRVDGTDELRRIQ